MTTDTLKRDIWLNDPAGGGVVESPGLLTVYHKNIRVVATVDNVVSTFDPGELRVTQAALDQFGVMEVVSMFVDHLKGVDWSEDPEDRKLNRIARKRGGVVYNVNRQRGMMIITYPGDNSTLILSGEY